MRFAHNEEIGGSNPPAGTKILMESIVPILRGLNMAIQFTLHTA